MHHTPYDRDHGGLARSGQRGGLMSGHAAPGSLTMAEQVMYVVGGLALAAAGTKPRPNFLLNIAVLGAGAYLTWRGTQGNCPVKAMIDGPQGPA